MLSYFVNTSRNTDNSAILFRQHLFGQLLHLSNWTSPRLKTGTSYSCPTNSVNVHMPLMLRSTTLGTHFRYGLTRTTPPSNLQLCFGKARQAVGSPWWRIHCLVLLSLLLCRTLAAFCDAGSRTAIRPVS